MVASVTNGLVELGVVTAGGTPAAEGGSGYADFAQLLEGIVGVQTDATPVSVPVLTLMPASAEQSSALDRNEVTDQADVPAEMLALCGLAMTVPPAQPLPAPIAAHSAGQSTAVMELKPDTASVEQPSAATTGSREFSATQLVDVQWLRSMTGAALDRPVSDSANAGADPVASADDAVGSESVSFVPGHDIEPALPRRLFQLLAQNVSAPTAQKEGQDSSPVMTVPEQLAGHMAGLWRAGRDGSATSAAQPPVLMPGMPHLEAEKITVTDNSAVEGTDVAGSYAPVQPQPVAASYQDISTDLQPRHQVHAHVGSAQWATELGNKLTLLATRDTQSATLYMTPADLGPVQVRIDMNQDQASVWFTAEHADTRSALEQSLPRLRELFTAQGMSLTDAGVFGNRSGQQQPQADTPAAVPRAWMGDEAAADTALVRSLSLGLLDAYA